jgi:dolichol-phosphate mannosyltransferase
MLSSAAPYLAAIDADLRHDERLLPQMLEILQRDDIDIVVGSRYAPSSDVAGQREKKAREGLIARRLSQALVRADLSDPASGFFMMRGSVLRRAAHRLSGMECKILADLFASSSGGLRLRELRYRPGGAGAAPSATEPVMAWEYSMLLLDKLLGHIVPARFAAFCLVAGVAVGVHFAVLALIMHGLGGTFLLGQAAATLCAMLFNYLLNDVLTHRDAEAHAWNCWRSWASFALTCGAGGIANVGVANMVYAMNYGWASAAAAGILIGAVWNYAVTLFTRRLSALSVRRSATPKRSVGSGPLRGAKPATAPPAPSQCPGRRRCTESPAHNGLFPGAAARRLFR